MTSSERIAIAAHMHVLLRRKTGRVTDTEWMATNVQYAAEITRFARQKSMEDGHADLASWADKLEEIMTEPGAKRRTPLVTLVKDALNAQPVAAGAAGAVGDRKSARSINTENEVFPDSGFIESTFGTFGDSEIHTERKPRDGAGPQYVKGLR
ncbi:MAG: hypothetical protein JWP47_63 [Polaromonas sp.]|jgi:hypothetical protein|nr:hypothetical protein [Polaromonas sp.]